MGMKVPPSCRKALTAAMEDAGISVPESEERWAAADEALIGVWASKFNDRAYYSMRKVGLNFMDLRMAVVVQRVVQARYAFVIHTNNPSTGADILSLAFCHVLCVGVPTVPEYQPAAFTRQPLYLYRGALSVHHGVSAPWCSVHCNLQCGGSLVGCHVLPIAL